MRLLVVGNLHDGQRMKGMLSLKCGLTLNCRAAERSEARCRQHAGHNTPVAWQQAACGARRTAGELTVG